MASLPLPPSPPCSQCERVTAPPAGRSSHHIRKGPPGPLAGLWNLSLSSRRPHFLPHSPCPPVPATRGCFLPFKCTKFIPTLGHLLYCPLQFLPQVPMGLALLSPSYLCTDVISPQRTFLTTLSKRAAAPLPLPTRSVSTFYFHYSLSTTRPCN